MNLLETAKSVLAAFFGVQSPANRERDFSEGNPAVFLVTGLIFTILFIATFFTFVTYITG